MNDPIFDKERRNSLDDATDKEWTNYHTGFIELPKDMILESVGDSVNHPPHYTSRRMEAIDIIEMIIETEKNPKVAYAMSNVLKYILRFRDKGKPVEDIKKSSWYLSRMIKHLEEE